MPAVAVSPSGARSWHCSYYAAWERTWWEYDHAGIAWPFPPSTHPELYDATGGFMGGPFGRVGFVEAACSVPNCRWTHAHGREECSSCPDCGQVWPACEC